VRKSRLLSSLAALVGASLIAVTGGVAEASAGASVGPVLSAVRPAASPIVPPPMRIVTSTAAKAPGLLIANPNKIYNTAPGQPWTGGPTIYDNAGHVVWYKPSETISVTEPVTYLGKPALAYYQRTRAYNGFGEGYWVLLNQSYQEIAQVHAGNGLFADHHEFELTKRGTALIDCYHRVVVDLTPFGGPARATVWEGVVQEINVATGKVVFEWHSLPHIPVTDSYNSLKVNNVDYFHMNAISEDTDGNLIVSGRDIQSLVKINRTTGAVMWRLGGKRSSFTFVGDTGPHRQHDGRAVGGGMYSVFDNGVGAKPQVSRGVTWKLNTTAHTATLVDVWRHTPDIFSLIMGSNRVLPNGNRLIGWAIGGVTTEYKGHTVVFESKFGQGATSYRMFRSVWNGTPSTPPTLTVSRTKAGVTAHASWNGATGIARWDLLAGPDAQHLRVVRAAPYAGYETTQSLPVKSTDKAFAVRAVRGAGVATATSQVMAAS
jgi:hypothetical protein